MPRSNAKVIEFGPIVLKGFAAKWPASLKKASAERPGLSQGLFPPTELFKDPAPCVRRQQRVRHAGRIERVFAPKASVGLEGGFGPAGLALNAGDPQQGFRAGRRFIDQGLERGDGAVVLLVAKLQFLGGVEDTRSRDVCNGGVRYK